MKAFLEYIQIKKILLIGNIILFQMNEVGFSRTLSGNVIPETSPNFSKS
jgi:hypothetical protein